MSHLQCHAESATLTPGATPDTTKRSRKKRTVCPRIRRLIPYLRLDVSRTDEPDAPARPNLCLQRPRTEPQLLLCCAVKLTQLVVAPSRQPIAMPRVPAIPSAGTIRAVTRAASRNANVFRAFAHLVQLRLACVAKPFAIESQHWDAGPQARHDQYTKTIPKSHLPVDPFFANAPRCIKTEGQQPLSYIFGGIVRMHDDIPYTN